MTGRNRIPMTSGVGVAHQVENCQTCTNPTKHPIGFWDGKDSHGQVFDCDNYACELKKAKNELSKMREEEKMISLIENEKNGISMEDTRSRRKELGITIAKMANGLGISCSEYSVYEQCREPLPVGLVDRIEGVFKKEIDRHLYAPRLKPEFGAIRWDVKA